MKTISPMKNQQTKVHLNSDIRNWERSERAKTIKMSRKQQRRNKTLTRTLQA